MKYAFFQGCNIPIRIEQYATSTTALLNHFGIELLTVPEFNCCGYPVRNIDEKAYVLPSVRNLALAEKLGLDILVICNCCFASLQKARNLLAKSPALAEELNLVLAKEGLQYHGKVKVSHYLSVLHQEVGAEQLRAKMVKMFDALQVSVLHGCHLLRPREVTQFDDSFVPQMTGELLASSGAANLDWPGSLECCGAALAGINDSLAQKLLSEKVRGARQAGAAAITPICAYCHLQLDTMQPLLPTTAEAGGPLPVLLLPQLLGLCLGLDTATLGLRANKTVSEPFLAELLEKLGPPVEKKKKKKTVKQAA